MTPPTTIDGANNDLSKLIQDSLQALLPTLVQNVEDVLRNKVLGPYLERLEALEKRFWNQELTIHRLLESEEIKKNKNNYSDVIIYNLKEDPRVGDRVLVTKAISRLMSSDNDVPSMSMLSDPSDMVLEARRLPVDPRPGKVSLCSSHFAATRFAMKCSEDRQKIRKAFSSPTTFVKKRDGKGRFY